MSELEQTEKMLLHADIKYIKTEGVDKDWSVTHGVWWLRIPTSREVVVYTFNKGDGRLVQLTVENDDD
jgi:hypothetical protein